MPRSVLANLAQSRQARPLSPSNIAISHPAPSFIQTPQKIREKFTPPPADTSLGSLSCRLRDCLARHRLPAICPGTPNGSLNEQAKLDATPDALSGFAQNDNDSLTDSATWFRRWDGGGRGSRRWLGPAAN